jgi:hypothetical protein
MQNGELRLWMECRLLAVRKIELLVIWNFALQVEPYQ